MREGRGDREEGEREREEDLIADYGGRGCMTVVDFYYVSFLSHTLEVRRTKKAKKKMKFQSSHHVSSQC